MLDSSFCEPLRPVGIVVFSPLIYVVMKLMHINMHHVTGFNQYPAYFQVFEHAAGSADRDGGIDPKGFVKAIFQIVIVLFVKRFHIDFIS